MLPFGWIKVEELAKLLPFTLNICNRNACLFSNVCYMFLNFVVKKCRSKWNYYA